MFDKLVKDYYGFDTYAGDLGIEVEMESNEAGFPVAPAGWKSEHDGSLKALFATEYVTSKPVKAEDYVAVLNRLKKRVKDIPLLNSVRAGVHVHVNCGEMTVNEMLRFAMTYMVMEIPLVKYCGPDREGNLFCLRAIDAEFMPHRLHEAISKQKLQGLTNNNNLVRYSSINFNSLQKYGSLEFRSMRTNTGLHKIEEWIEMLLRIRDYSSTLPTASQIAYEISLKSPSNWAEDILGTDLFKEINYEGFEKDIMKGLRAIQPSLFNGV